MCLGFGVQGSGSTMRLRVLSAVAAALLFCLFGMMLPTVGS